ncbi:hypothetical protein D9619_001438 [Psilocybe cf. subviscida]|uniref:Uncharacterized protein n=1 Tax=Psilocybe cf. subviscida TaxID=2480587 RepID=A0A8H5F488_9AGAR|nr:hypothetical protein D9619_001438 [Psilocybe cf. subviscida]
MLSQRFLRSGPSTRLFSALKSRSILSSSTSSVLHTAATKCAPKAALSVTQRHHFSTTRPAGLPRSMPSQNNIAPPSEEIMAAVGMLEQTAAQPFLQDIPTDPEDRLRRAVTLILQIVLYLGIPRGTSEQGMQFLMAFGSAPVGPKSEIARARRASVPILRAVIRDINSIPEDHPLREQAKDMFESLKVVTMLSEVHLLESEDAVLGFTHFWPVSQEHILQILDDLSAAGYGVDMEKLGEEALNDLQSENQKS